MLKRLLFSLKPTAWLLALLIITSALPARAQSEFYDEFYDDPDFQEQTFKFEFSDDLNGYIISPNKHDGAEWDREMQLWVPSIRLQDGKPVVGLSGFGSLKWLDLIFFPEECHVKYICNECFEYCTSLGLSEEPLNLPESVENIGDYAFYGCTNLRSINLSSNLISIGVSAFELCKSLESITLPKSLKVIREYAFRYCANF
ncbi:MAG: leucine-rich repeat domain-containing protein, partial [Muribaculaceae bacterium]